MMESVRRNRGRFEIRRFVASLAGMAVLALSPAIVSVADSRLDGVQLAFTEAVFGESASAQVIDPCVAEAEVEFRECLESVRWYARSLCRLKLVADLLVCAVTD